MELPTLGENDPRPTKSPWYSLQNIQVTKKVGNSIEIYGGIKNILNWTPWRSMDTDMITRANDPFEKDTTDPNQLSFDAAYVYGPNQGIRGFLGLRYKFNR
jgi:outer membrane receptor for ferrienterochelin and colicins